MRSPDDPTNGDACSNTEGTEDGAASSIEPRRASDESSQQGFSNVKMSTSVTFAV